VWSIITVPSLYFTNNGLHTHLLFSAQEVRAYVPTLQAYFPDATWLQIGWGDYQYYGNPEQKKWMGVKALFTPTAAIMGILGVNAILEDIPKKRKLYEIPLDTGHWNTVLAFVCGYLKLDDANQMTEVDATENPMARAAAGSRSGMDE
jgi:hypothetical protein